jgi:two-component sensor histidine kinase
MTTESERLGTENGRQGVDVARWDNEGGAPGRARLANCGGESGTDVSRPIVTDAGGIQVHAHAAEKISHQMNGAPASTARASAVWDERHLRAATRAAGVALWAWNVDTDAINMDERAFDLWGIPSSERTITFETLSRNIHPADLLRVRSAFVATRAIVGSYEIDFRILHDGELRWISARGQGDDVDIAERLMFGIFLDVTQRKQAEEANELLAGEMSHRVTNLLQIATALTHMSSRSASTKEEMAQALASRLMALGRAQGLVRPTPGNKVEAALLGDLLAVLLAPYDEQGATVRIRISVPKLRVGETSSTTLALVIHELATNAAKYGALSTDAGTLDVSCNIKGDEVVVVWTERGSPTRVAPANPSGFGSKLVDRTVSAQLGGSIAFNWSPEGVVVTLRMSKRRMEA